jgi:hypothetical protein
MNVWIAFGLTPGGEESGDGLPRPTPARPDVGTLEFERLVDLGHRSALVADSTSTSSAPAQGGDDGRLGLSFTQLGPGDGAGDHSSDGGEALTAKTSSLPDRLEAGTIIGREVMTVMTSIQGT